MTFPRLRLRDEVAALLDLPWEQPLAEWGGDGASFRELPVGPSRHLVRFMVSEGTVYALKELPAAVAVPRSIDEVARAKRWDSGDAAEAALLRYLRPLLGDRANFPQHLHEEAREAGWTEEQLLEAIAVLSMESFTAMVNIAGDVPVDGSVEETRVLRAA